MPTANRMVVSPELGAPAGPWSSAIEIRPGARYVFTAGLVGARTDGTFDADITGQANQTFGNLVKVLAAANMGLEHVVKLVIYLTDIAANQPGYGEVRKKFMGDIKPAMTLIEVPRLARPGILLEIEAVAARHD